MKKTLFILCALMLTAVGANATTVDLTGKNTTASWQGTSGTFSNGVENYNGSGHSTGKLLYQTVTGLDASTAYVIEFFAAVNNANGDTKPYGENFAQVYAGSTTKDITVEAKSGGAFDSSDATKWGDAYHHFLVATTDANGSIEFGVQNVTAAGNWAIAYAVSATPLEEYTGSATAHKCTSDESVWNVSSGGTTPALNTWSIETDASGMVIPFCQVWVDYNQGLTLAQQTISHTQLTGLPAGVYTVSIDARIFAEGALTIGDGTLFTANGESVDLSTYGLSDTYGTETEKYGTYSVQCTVTGGDDSNAGNLDISITIPNSSNYNWLAWKNLNVEYRCASASYQVGTTASSGTSHVLGGETVVVTIDDCFKSSTTSTTDAVALTATGATFGSTSVDLTAAWGEGSFSFTVPTGLSLNTEYTLTIPASGIVWTEGTTQQTTNSEAITLTFRTPVIWEQDGIYLKNLFGGDLLSRGKDLGARADVDFVGMPLTMKMKPDGTFTIWYKDVDPDNATEGYLYGSGGAWAWSDGSYVLRDSYCNYSRPVTTFAVEAADEGYLFKSDYGYLYRYDIADTSGGGTTSNDDYALAVNGVYNDNYTQTAQATWAIVDQAARDEIKAGWVESQKLAVAEAAGITVTSGDDFDKYVASLTPTAVVTDAITNNDDSRWTVSGSTNGFNTSYGVEVYETYGRLTRTISNLDKGIYKVTLNGLDRHSGDAYCWEMYKNLGYTDLSTSYLVAGDYEINLKPWASEATLTGSTYYPDNVTDLATALESGYLNELYTYVGDGRTLNIAIAMLVNEARGWAAVKNLTVYRLDQTETEISWEMTDAGYGTLILPFDAEIPQKDDNDKEIEWTAYTIDSVTTDNDDDDIAATLSLSDAGRTIEANTPYIMGGTEGTYTFTGTPTNTATSYTKTMSGVSLTGTLVDMSLANGDFTTTGNQYVLQNHDEGGLAFYPITTESEKTGVTLDAYHCYLTYSNTSGVKGFISFAGTDGEATAIVAVESEEAEGNGAIYDLSGRKVSKAVKGVYIQNGKKVLVK